jgi:nuclear transport factor 2 (NTF2) superfamily protein
VLTAALLVLATGLVAVGWVQGLPVSIIGVTSTGEPIPQATGLNPQIEAAFARAQADAAHEGIALTLTSGWRSAAEQEQLVRDYIQRYGSVQEAHRLVLPPSRSAHVQGNAIDVGDAMGASWLDEHGSAYGLCRTYANETWHFEQVIEPGGSCPPMKPDASHGWQ